QRPKSGGGRKETALRDIELVQALPRSLGVGEPIHSGPLGLVPIFGGRPAPEYDLAAEAMKADTLRVAESRDGGVARIEALNRGRRPVLLIEGELLDGAAQDRVLNVSVLLPAMDAT